MEFLDQIFDRIFAKIDDYYMIMDVCFLCFWSIIEVIIVLCCQVIFDKCYFLVVNIQRLSVVYRFCFERCKSLKLIFFYLLLYIFIDVKRFYLIVYVMLGMVLYMQFGGF